MKATGIVRRIDDLGRVVIPKEIRRTMHIREGDPLEIFTNSDGGVIFKKYSLMGGLGDFPASCASPFTRPPGRWWPSPTGTPVWRWPAAAGRS